VLYNLLINAFQALKDGGEVKISTWEDKSGNLLISIKDNGPGIPKDVRESIFDPFVTTKKAGTGLGLAVVRQIIGQHQGSIEARDYALGKHKGAEFVITLRKILVKENRKCA